MNWKIFQWNELSSETQFFTPDKAERRRLSALLLFFGFYLRLKLFVISTICALHNEIVEVMKKIINIG